MSCTDAFLVECGSASQMARMNADAPILFFDSGVGGLSVLAPTRALLPNAPIVYAADSAGYPYGKRSIPAELGALADALEGETV